MAMPVGGQKGLALGCTEARRRLSFAARTYVAKAAKPTSNGFRNCQRHTLDFVSIKAREVDSSDGVPRLIRTATSLGHNAGFSSGYGSSGQGFLLEGPERSRVGPHCHPSNTASAPGARHLVLTPSHKGPKRLPL